MASFASLKSAIYDREERKQQYQAYIKGLNAYDRHKKFLKDYGENFSYYGKGEGSLYPKPPVKTDQDTLREGYRFIRTEEDDMDTSWEQRLVKRYYNKLFKEYCIADMSKYKTGKIGLRWRTEKEVISGKGQFICGNRHCDEKDDLASYEVNFSYFEAGESKQALVKLVVCESCAGKLHYKKNKEKELLEQSDKEERKRGRHLTSDERVNSHEISSERMKKKSKLEETEDKEECKRKRERSKSDDATDYKLKKSKERHQRGKETSLAGDPENGDEDFDEFLEGMFP